MPIRDDIHAHPRNHSGSVKNRSRYVRNSGSPLEAPLSAPGPSAVLKGRHLGRIPAQSDGRPRRADAQAARSTARTAREPIRARKRRETSLLQRRDRGLQPLAGRIDPGASAASSAAAAAPRPARRGRPATRGPSATLPAPEHTRAPTKDPRAGRRRTIRLRRSAGHHRGRPVDHRGRADDVLAHPELLGREAEGQPDELGEVEHRQPELAADDLRAPAAAGGRGSGGTAGRARPGSRPRRRSRRPGGGRPA